MKTYYIKLQDRQIIAKNTMNLIFIRPKDFNYEAGQYVSLALPNLVDQYPRVNTRLMSLASAPSEKYLMFSMRLSDSAFKRSLQDMVIGETIEMRGPVGKLILSAGDEPLVFIAGGIGVAPFRSMLLESQAQNWPRLITFFYANKNKSDAVFLNQLLSWENKNFKIVPIMTRDSTWPGETGHLQESTIKKYVSRPHDSIYYIVGLPKMVGEVQSVLKNMGISSERIKTELFTGY